MNAELLLQQLSHSSLCRKPGEVLLASTYESATYFCLLQVTVQSLESANKNITQGGYLIGRHVLHDNNTKSQETSDPMIIIVERVMRALWHEKISRVPRKDETKLSLRWAEERERTLSHIDDAVNPSRAFLFNFSGPRSTTTYSCCSSPSSVNLIEEGLLGVPNI